MGRQVKIDFSRITGVASDIKPRLPLRVDTGVDFFEKDTKDMYMWMGDEWVLWMRAWEHVPKTFLDLYDTPDEYVIGGLPIVNPEGDGLIFTDYIRPTGLEAINEGAGIGWRFLGRNPSYFGPIGLNAVDLSTGITGIDGATGNYSLAAGLSVYAKSYGEVAVGLYNTSYNASSTITPVGTDRLFGIGNGVSTGNRSDAMLIYKSGLGVLPQLTVQMINDEPTGKSMVTKEWVLLSAFPEAPNDGQQYARQSLTWTVVEPSGITDAPSDGNTYGRKDGAWSIVDTGGGIGEAPIDGTPYMRQDEDWVSYSATVPGLDAVAQVDDTSTINIFAPNLITNEADTYVTFPKITGNITLSQADYDALGAGRPANMVYFIVG